MNALCMSCYYGCAQKFHSKCRKYFICNNTIIVPSFTQPTTYTHATQCECATKEIHGDEYPGPYQMSEPEVKVIMEYIRCIAPVYGAIDFHSYGQNVIYPYRKLVMRIWQCHECCFIHPPIGY